MLKCNQKVPVKVQENCETDASKGSWETTQESKLEIWSILIDLSH